MNRVKTVLFDIDCGEITGYGHLSRALAVAEVMNKENFDCFFRSDSPLGSTAMEMISQSGLTYEATIPEGFDLRIIDKYTNKQGIVPENAKKIVQFVDQTSIDLGADIYVSVSPTKNWAQYKSFHKAFLNDPPLRRSVVDLANQMSVSKNARILFLAGGTNQSALKNSIIETIREQSSNLPIDILVYSSEEIIDTAGTDINLVTSSGGLLEVMSHYSMVVSACGVSAWELIALQKRVCLFSLVENQDFQLEEMGRSGHTLVLEMEKGRLAFKNLVHTLQRLQSGKASKKHAIRLDGAQRIFNFIESLN
jgi:spore coat polysaccharide biosynthesis predicted glycosyltransferase SpsG